VLKTTPGGLTVKVSTAYATDDINQKFGEFMVAPSRLIGRSEMPSVITPSWQPTGRRKTV